MPVHTHKALPPVDNEDAVIWRYLDFAKLVDLLLTEELHFCRSDMLGDPFEGSLPKLNAMFLDAKLSPDSRRNRAEHNKRLRERICVNCWHENTDESAAMWKTYADSEGVAIQTTFKLLEESLAAYEPAVYVGTVKYINHLNCAIPANNALYPFGHKDKSLKHESELRALVYAEKPVDYGVRVPVDLRKLIYSVYVAPSAAPWLHGLVENTLERLGFGDIPVVKSGLCRTPLF